MSSSAYNLPELRPAELLAWNGFLATEPNFAGESIVEWRPGPDPPDVICQSVSKRVIGVELTTWVEHSQLTRGKTRERLERQYLEILKSESEPCPKNIGMVWLLPTGRRVKPEDVAQFRRETYSFMNQQNDLEEPKWGYLQGAPVNEFSTFPMLKKYMASFWIYSKKQMPLFDGAQWLTFRAHGGAYTPTTMVEAALERVFDKIDYYQNLDLRGQHAIQELDLICHYDDNALFHNTSIHGLGFGYPEIAKEVAQGLAEGQSVFDKIFLYNPWETPQVIQVYPSVL
jgi:hypothetical protein